MRFHYIVLAVALFTNIHVFAQTLFYGTPIPQQIPTSQQLTKHIKDYQLFNISTSEISTHLRSANGNKQSLLLQLGNSFSWQLQLIPNDLRSPDFKLILLTQKGRQTLPTPSNIAYKGILTGGGEVRLSFDDGFIYGFLTLENGIDMQIEPLQYWIPNAPKDVFIVYKATDLINTHPVYCANSTHPSSTPPLPDIDQNRQAGECTEIELAFVADYLLLKEKGSADKVNKHLNAILNAVQPSYEVFDIEFVLTEIVISGCETCDGFSNTLDPAALQTSFATWGNAGGFTQPYDVAQLWTNRDFTGSVVGVSPVATLCSNNRYSVVQDYSANFNSLRALSAHELGHCFGASHDPSNSFFLMQPTILPTLTQFSDNSIGSINNHLSSRTCLDHYCPFCLAATQIAYNNSTYTLTWQDDAPACQISIKRSGETNWLLQTTTIEQFYTFTGLSDCYNYEVELQPVCAGNVMAYPQTFNITALTSPANITVLQPIAGTATINWTNGGSLVNVKIKETGSAVYLVNTVVTTNTYTVNGLSACKNYTVELQSICSGLLLSNIATATINAIVPYVAYGLPLSATSANVGFITYTFTGFDYLLRVKQQGSATWIFETAAISGVNYPISGLQPCTFYEVYAYANCGGGQLGPPRTQLFKTSNLFISSATAQNCNPVTATYELALTVNYLQLSGQFNVSVNGTNYLQNYTGSPQQVIIPNLPANGNSTITVSVADITNPSLCLGSVTYTGFRPQCECSTVYSETFDACTIPPGWSNSSLGFNPSALWQFGTTNIDSSINGNCMAFFDDDAFDTDGGESVMLTSPSINLSNFTAAALRFKYNFNTIGGFFRVRVWSGSNWEDVIYTFSSNCGFWGCNYAQADIDITPYLNSNLQVRFIYNDGEGWDWYAGIDDFEICAFSSLNTCNAGFYYPSGNTYCKVQGIVQPVITGNPNGTFASIPTGLSINSQTGAIQLNSSVAGTYTVQYSSGSFGGCTQNATITITETCPTPVFVKAVLQGAYNTTTGLMNTTLNNINVIPLAQPYNIPPFNYNGTEAFANAGAKPNNMVDWVMIELRETTSKTLVARKAAVLLNDGWIVDVNGSSANGVLFTNIPPNTHYFLTVRHRNHIAVMSDAPVLLPNSGNSFDFSQAVTKAYGNNQQILTGGKAMLFLGDADGNGVITRGDFNKYRQQFLQLSGYKEADFNMDGDVSSFDFSAMQPNMQLIGLPFLRY